MKILMVMIILLMITFPVCAQRVVTDSLGNRLNRNAWTLFTIQNQFHHPNGNWYPSPQTGGICWVYTTQKRQNRFCGLLTVGGLSWGVYDALHKGYMDDWQSWSNVGSFWARFGGCWLWGNALDSPNTYACRNAGAITGTIWSISQTNNFGLSWQRGPTWQEASIMAGELISPILLGWWLDKIRHVPSSKPAYRYTIRCRR